MAVDNNNNTHGDSNITDDNLYEEYEYIDKHNISDLNITDDYIFEEYEYEDYEYEEFLYQGYSFESIIYLYIWNILIVLVTLANILVILILFRRNLRSSTNIVLIGIAVAETLTVLVTLPTYIYTFHQDSGDIDGSTTYVLSKDWCNAFMISKFFLSKSFHTVSIWLHCFLGFQRFVSIQFPFRAQYMFTMTKTFVVICVICLLAPIMHIYHAINMKAVGGVCSWQLEINCETDCAYIWTLVLLVHIIPCVLLIVFTGIMIRKLTCSADSFDETDGANQTGLMMRNEENKRATIVVVAVLIAFIIPELPYGAFLSYSATLRFIDQPLMKLKTNRAFFAGYEVLLALSYCANVCIYLVLNKTFKKEFYKIFCSCHALKKREPTTEETHLGSSGDAENSPLNVKQKQKTTYDVKKATN